MEFILFRDYFAGGTNGTLFCNGNFICFTIELPWEGNRKNISCVPEGRYELFPRFSSKFGNHLLVRDVPGRNFILLHAANNAKQDLRGCIAPVHILNGIGKGLQSKEMLQRILSISHQAFEEKITVSLTILSTNYDTIRTLYAPNTKIF
ncbi:DUF5675 family protein [Aegicerativicinus sediminis]|uniref:DUF5675 family protein n=1 Tax=Aegicerativicinus sediminis TaxID=2893202 RepID=UPI001E37C15F|nr:DUF5675 family protein [Aegicerativicinus sediminis]